MSGVVKGVKKVFKTVGKIVKKVWKPLVIAAAVYFTAGAALSYFGAAGAAGAGAGGAFAGASAGAGAAAGVGAGAAGAAAAATAAATTAAGAFAGAGAGAGAAAGVGAGVGGGTLAGATASGAFTRTALRMALGKGGINQTIAATTTSGTGGLGAGGIAAGGSTAGAAAAGTTGGGFLGSVGSASPSTVHKRVASGIERLMWTQTLISGVSGLMAPKPPTPDEAARANARFRGSYFGVNERGVAEFDPAQAYGEFMAPRQGESYRGAIPDRGIIQPPTATATAGAASAPVTPAATSRPVLANRQQQAPNFIDPENTGAYSPDDTYGIT